ncbi:MAG: MFS transporter [Dehalococcoidia bacterium]|nr:MFS transporter [Dehalococcoidia bacterium]
MLTPLLQQFRFARFLASALTANIGQNALSYTLLIVVIKETGSGIHTSLFVLCSLFPVIVLGLVAGVVVDHLPNKLTLATANAVRAVAVALLLYEPTNVWAIYVVASLLWTVQLFSSPAASSALPAILPMARISSGQALVDVVNLLAQLIGMVIFAPIVLKVIGPEPVYVVTAALYGVAAYLVLTIPDMTDQKMKRLRLQAESRRMQLVDVLSAGWRMLRADNVAFQAMVQYTLLGTATAIVVVLVPQYTEDVVRTKPENLVYIFSPAAAGLAVGLWLAPVLGRTVGNPAAARIGFAAFVSSIAGFAVSGLIADLVEEQGFLPLEEIADFFRVRMTVVVTMLLAFPGGVGAGIVGIATKAVLFERAPPEARGRIFATQNWASGVLSVVPTFLAGLVSSLVDVRFAIFILAFALAAVAIYARFGMQPWRGHSPAPG